ncbi:hypothetical protein O1611_g7627 [Lasiodiplodia mahajangana]|uniref:Uncharacterized protein n=1 Tax=Lasiodiplodia mahajangana TaxID=1108764 RepID=A0ACC2JEZ2_9PEZI|nr:hypothetical protein O1611_g7627 [Lasiodiplodia mahajangana]
METSIAVVTLETINTLALLLITIILVAAVAIGVRRFNAAAANDWARFSPTVLGEWADYHKREFSWRGLRWKIEYELPFISLGSLEGGRAPVEGTRFYSILGTKSDMHINVDGVDAGSEELAIPRILSHRVLAPQDERASWAQLLAIVQLMERDSTNWENRKWQLDHNSQGRLFYEDLVTLVVGVQRLRRAYYQVLPTMAPKPYAAITFAHLVGLAAMLSINWKEFNQVADNYFARGNGFLLRGRRSDMGLVFTFERTGPYHFQETRIIPTAEVNELCFGHIPTFLRGDYPIEDSELQKQRALKTLRLGSSRDIAGTLRLIGCNATTIHYYLEGGRTAHIFPVVFEVIGMLGRILHIPGRYFTYLPNPTIFAFDKQNFSLRRLLHGFVDQMDMLGDEKPRGLHKVRYLAKSLLEELPQQSWQWYPLKLLNKLNEITFSLEDTIRYSKDTERLTLEIVRLHLEATHTFINNTTRSRGEPADEHIAQQSLPEGGAALETSIGGFPNRIEFPTNNKTDDLFNCPPWEIEKRLMKIYFEKIRPIATTIDKSFIEIWANDNPDQPAGDSGLKEGSRPDIPTELEDGDAVVLWCALVLRMICWLSLHNFDRDDVQIEKDGVMGSRMVVYLE